MDKFEAKTLLQKLDIVQGFLDKKNLPQLQRKLNVEVNSLKKDSFEAWISSLPESVKEILYDKLTSDQLYATFFPSVFHNALSKEEIILVFSILKSKNEIEQCRLESSEKLYDLRKYLQFIVENDKSRFLSIFQNRATKENS